MEELNEKQLDEGDTWLRVNKENGSLVEEIMKHPMLEESRTQANTKSCEHEHIEEPSERNCSHIQHRCVLIAEKVSSETDEFSNDHEEDILSQFLIQSEDEISEDECGHTNAEQGIEIYFEDENVYTPSTSSYKLDSETNTLEEESMPSTTTSHEHESELFSEAEREVLNMNLVFSNDEQELTEIIMKHDLSIVLKLHDHGMGNFSKDNEALHGESMKTMLVM